MSKENLHFDDQSIEVAFPFFGAVFSKRNEKTCYRNTLESLGELEKAVETLAYGSCSHSVSRSPKLPIVFLFNN